jgi:hypothetical protein
MSVAFQAYCNTCEWYGPMAQNMEQAARSGDMHQAETGHTDVDVVESTPTGQLIVESAEGETDV